MIIILCILLLCYAGARIIASYYLEVKDTSNDTSVVHHTVNQLYSIANNCMNLFLYLLLLLSGDIELNPGPITGKITLLI